MSAMEMRINYLKETKIKFKVVGNNIIVNNEVNVYNSQGEYLLTYER
jgi:hypothetical protein